MTAVFEPRGPARYGPFLVMLAIALAIPSFASGAGPGLRWWLAAGALAVLMFAAWGLGERSAQPNRLGLMAAFLAFPTILLLEKADPDHATAFVPLLILPIVWCALYESARQLALAVALAGAALFLPIALIGAPAYGTSTWRRSVLWLVVLGLIALATQMLVRSARRAAAQLAAGEQRYRTAFADAPVAIAIIGADGGERGEILQANHPLHELFGYPEGSLVGRLVTDFAHPDDIDRFTRELKAVAIGTTRHTEIRLTQATGQLRWVSASLVLIRPSPEQPLRYVCHIEDITARRESERSLLDALEQQGVASARLREVARARTDLVAAVSHDVRTPLATIGAYVQLLESGAAGELTADQRAMVDVIEQNVRRTYAITDDLLTLGQLEHAGAAAAREAVPIGDLLVRVVGSVEPSAAARDQRLSLASRLDGVMVAGHAGQLDRVLANLLTNAVKFTPTGGTITVCGHLDGPQVVIGVTDSGDGIPAGEQASIFERFYRSDSARTRGVAGTGLGLAIASEIATLHGGTVGVRSTPGRGATFTLTLPALAKTA